MFGIYKKIIFLPLICFFIFFPNKNVNAIEVSPAIKHFYVKPGEQVLEKISVVNDTNSKLVLYPVVENFKSKNNTGTPEFLGDIDPEGAARWIQLPFQEVLFLPRERKDFLFKINVPQWVKPGGYYAALLWSTREKSKNNGVESISRIGSLFLFAVEGSITGEVNMTNLNIVKNKKVGLEGFSFGIENKSTIHVIPQGKIEIYDIFGRKVEEFNLNAQGKSVLAQSKRNFFEEWKKPYESWGKLHVRVRGEYGFGLTSTEKELSFYNFPKFAGIKILIFVGCIFFILKKVFQYRGLKKKHKLILE